MGYIKPMNTIRVPTAKFKYNMSPFVQEAKQGKQVIVTNYGRDEFEVVPCAPIGTPPTCPGLVSAKDYEGVDMNEPAFASWEQTK
jgi:antitoxin (DNA-binding transcriptional repressor) of toxin-antitoxin stability system